MYKLTFKSQAVKYLRKMPKEDAARVRDGLAKLAEDPDRAKLDVKPLRARPGYRLRIGGTRVIFERDDGIRVIAVARIAPRGDVYKK